MGTTTGTTTGTTPGSTPGTTTGIVLAAGAGVRMGGPKALRRDGDEPWLRRAAAALAAGGCDRVVVVLGAAAEQARPLLAGVPVEIVLAPDWATGMGASLRAALTALSADDAADCAVVTLVDLPDVGADVVGRVLAAVGPSRQALGRAAYGGVPGHPVVLGRDHWPGVLEAARGDRGARDYLADHPGTLVECGDLATGRDVDTPS